MALVRDERARARAFGHNAPRLEGYLLLRSRRNDDPDPYGLQADGNHAARVDLLHLPVPVLRLQRRVLGLRRGQPV